MKLRSSLFLTICTLALCACKKEASLSYRVKNIAFDSIMVVSALPADSLIDDTTMIGYNQTRTIRIVFKGKGHVSSHKETAVLISAFGELQIYRNTLIPATAALLATNRWHYTENGASQADYVLTVTKNDF